MSDAATTLTTASPLRRGMWISLDGEGLLRVTGCTGSGPYTVTVRRLPAWRIWLAHVWLRVRGPWRRWRESRCMPDEGWCWHRATYDYMCDRHNLEAIERGETP